MQDVEGVSTSEVRASDLPIEDQKVKVGVRTLVGVVVAVVGFVAAAVASYSDLPRRSQVEAALKSHNADVDAHGLVGRLDAIKTGVTTQGFRIERLENQQKRVEDDVSYIRARIDFLTEQSIIEGGQNPRSRIIIQRAASNVRGRAGSGEDPLKGLDLDQ